MQKRWALRARLSACWNRGSAGLSDKWLRKLAPVLGTRPGHLLDVDPHDVNTDILEIWANTPESKRPQLLAVMNTFREDASPPAPFLESR